MAGLFVFSKQTRRDEGWETTDFKNYGLSINLFASHFATVHGTESYSCQPKTNPSVGNPERSIDKQQTSLSELLSTIIRGRERSDQENAAQGKIALAI